MTEERNTTNELLDDKPHIPTRKEFHQRFGGIISAVDFNTEYAGKLHRTSRVAKRIFSDMRFDISCQRNIDTYRRYKINGKEF